MKRGIIIPGLMLFLGAVYLCSCGNADGGHPRDSVFWSPDRAPYRAANAAVERRSHVGWATGNHTAAPVPVGSAGPAAYTSRLSGMMENTMIGSVMRDALSHGTSVILVIGDGFGPTHLALA
ncbi:MAG: alkaline phosphatase, partial [Spirochaetes bacterium]|nr:alkaline phosphatase [Spirochaetota bacterium]